VRGHDRLHQRAVHLVRGQLRQLALLLVLQPAELQEEGDAREVPGEEQHVIRLQQRVGPDGTQDLAARAVHLEQEQPGDAAQAGGLDCLANELAAGADAHGGGVLALHCLVEVLEPGVCTDVGIWG